MIVKLLRYLMNNWKILNLNARNLNYNLKKVKETIKKEKKGMSEIFRIKNYENWKIAKSYKKLKICFFGIIRF